MMKELKKIFDQSVHDLIWKAPIGTITGNRKEIEKFIVNHERKEKIINSCFGQLKTAENKSSVKVRVKEFKGLIKAVAAMFMDAAIEERNQKHLSRNEKDKRVKDFTRMDRLEEQAKAEGFFTEVKNDNPL